jgi:hypothetical protein
MVPLLKTLVDRDIAGHRHDVFRFLAGECSDVGELGGYNARACRDRR